METLLDPRISYVLSGELAPFRSLFIRHCSPTVEFLRGAIISACGSVDAPMYYLLSGMVEIFTTNSQGNIRILGYHQPDSVFAMDRICFDDPAVVSTKAVTPVVALRVTEDSLAVMARENPKLMPAILRYYGKVLRLMCYDAEIKSIGDVTSRLASFLYLSSARQPHLHLTQEELAAAVNASRVQVTRVCTRLQREGFITSGRGTTTVLDRSALLEISQKKG
ncbi:MAG: Crp/Fnr family transcriptional regulator [Clostridia bacterium]|nr:Crp/Fnr family transcriptional regulator [Clostridia bacterium]